MSQYIVERTKSNRIYLAWIGLFLLTFNVYHSILMAVLSLYSAASTMVIQGVAVCCLIAYLLTGDGIKLTSIQLSTVDILSIFSLAAVVISTKDYANNLTYIIRYAVYIVVVILLKYDRRLVSILFTCLLLAGLLHLFFTLWFYIDKDFYMRNIFPYLAADKRGHLYNQVVINGYATGMAGHYSLNGIYIATSLCCVYTLLYERKKTSFCLMLLLMLVNVVALFMTGKRGVILFSIVAIVITYLICSKQTLGTKLTMAIFAFVIAMTILSIFAMFNKGVAGTLTRFFDTLLRLNTDDISSGRFRLYEYAWNFFLDKPILGIGWRRFTQYIMPLFHGKKQLMDTHNVFLQLLCETGVVGFAAFFLLFSVSYVMTIRYVILCKEDKVELPRRLRVALTFSLCYQTFFLGYCITGNPLYDLETLFAYFVALAAISHIDHNYKDRIKTDRPQIVSKYIR